MELGVRTLAFPAISCGIYGYPPELAAEIAVAAVHGHELELVRFVLFDETRLRGVRPRFGRLTAA